ncbi:SGNH hydrolase-type esterase domain-containing protein [Crepidotus variabilis]|uniref:SGNH hydrolase-type esterase domain-containing protein n=1 Tax=Crepidotus variabilis TaxID=179855 RepID=A0A9P6JUI6_9AGAR|nr:SGNH hydrolase-type esterase domain-containing protein [Crepidotus variabilis]
MNRSAAVQDVFMLFGDSITQGGWEPDMNSFGQRLSHVYARRLDVLNRGYSGYNTEWGRFVLQQCIDPAEVPGAPQIRVLAIWFGANDACIKPSPQHVPLPRFIENIKRMISLGRVPANSNRKETRIILISPPPVNTIVRKADLESRSPPMKLDREFDITRAYADAVRDVAKGEGVAFVDVWSRIWEAAGQNESALQKFLVDGLHLNAEGYNIMYDELIGVIAREYPEIHYDNIPYTFPAWKDINWTNPESSFKAEIV